MSMILSCVFICLGIIGIFDILIFGFSVWLLVPSILFISYGIFIAYEYSKKVKQEDMMNVKNSKICPKCNINVADACQNCPCCGGKLV